MLNGLLIAEDADLWTLDANAGADKTPNGKLLAVEERHDGRVIASDNELLASLIRRKHIKIVCNKCRYIRRQILRRRGFADHGGGSDGILGPGRRR